MPLFKKRGKTEHTADQPSATEPAADTLLLDEEELRQRLVRTLAAATSRASQFCVICLAPQVLPGQSLPDPELQAAMAVLDRHVRPTDYAGRLGPERLVVVLPDTVEPLGRIVCHRMATELTVQSTRFNHRKWFGGIVAFPGQASRVDDLLTVSVENARARPGAAA